jgi:hypothetical protein
LPACLCLVCSVELWSCAMIMYHPVRMW